MSCPTGKITFTTRISAWQWAIKDSNKFGHTLRPYTCKYCRRFHLTKREDTVRASTIPFKVGMRLNLQTGEIIKKIPKKHKKPKVYYPMPKKPVILKEVPEWKKKILRFIIRLLKI